MDYVNHYLTVKKLAEHYGMPIETTTKLIEVGKTVSGTTVKRYLIGYVAGIIYTNPVQEWLYNGKKLCGHGDKTKIYETMKKAVRVAENQVIKRMI